MYIYWRVQSDLNEFGNALILNHPNLQREFERWVKKNADGLALAEQLDTSRFESLHLSLN